MKFRATTVPVPSHPPFYAASRRSACTCTTCVYVAASGPSEQGCTPEVPAEGPCQVRILGKPALERPLPQRKKFSLAPQRNYINDLRRIANECCATTADWRET